MIIIKQYSQHVTLPQSVYTKELSLVEQFSSDFAVLCDDSESVKAEISDDVIALCEAYNLFGAELSIEHLLHEPPGTEARARHQQRFQSEDRSGLVAHVAHQRNCSGDDAENLVRLLEIGGLRDIVAWRCQVTRYELGIVRIRRLLSDLTASFPMWAQQRSEQYFVALWRAMCDVIAPFHIEPILTEYPSSDHRLRLSRRLPWSHASLVKQYLQRKKGRLSSWPPPSPLARRAQAQEGEKRPEDPLITSFRAKLSMTGAQGSHTLHRIITLGTVGCFSNEEVPLLFDKCQYSWLRMIEFGRIDGRIVWDRVYAQLRVDSEHWKKATPAKQVARTLFNSFATPRYWQLGKGGVTDGRLRQSPALYDAGLPQANDIWIAFDIPIIIGKNWRRQQRYRMICVADPEGQLIMGGWSAANNGTENDLGLALYQAIWHPGNVNWPFRGLPRRIIVTRALIGDREDDLRKAAAYLLAEIEIVDRISLEGKGRLVSAREMIRKEAIQLLSVGQTERMALPNLLQHTLERLRTQEYAQQRIAPVPRDLRCFGVAMPGFDTPAAGWLLPRSPETAEAYTNGVRYQSQWYRADHQCIVPGQHLVVRVFPATYPHVEPVGRQIGIFVEVDIQGEHCLHYLEPANE